MASINPYLTFNGNCEQAFNFYRSIFGGEFGFIGRYKDMPAEYDITENEKEKIMHISLPIGKDTSLMGADASGSFGGSPEVGHNISISVNADSEEEAKKLFGALSAEGNITMPLDKTFWGALFGMLTDKYGIDWMMSYEDNSAKPQATQS